MPQYRYQARNRNGQSVTGLITAESSDQVVEQLLDDNLTPIDITEQAAAGGLNIDWDALPVVGSKVGIDDLILFSRQMYSITKAGVPVMQGMARLRESTANKKMVKILGEIIHDLEAGRDIAGSFNRHRDTFGTLYINLLRVGEMTGQLENAFEAMYRYLTHDRDTINKIKSATRYPLFVIIAISVAIGILTAFVIPAFAQVFAGADMELPLATRIILAVSHFAAEWWHIILGGIVIAALAFKLWTRTSQGRLIWHRILLKLPVLGSIVLRATIARFTRAFGLALQAGVPVTQALAGVARAAGNAHVTEKLLGMQSGIEQGESVLRVSAASGVFTPIALQMISVGEETGQLDAMMLEVADYYDREVAYDVDNLSSIIEPILTIAVGIMVLILALGIFLPMWELTALATG